MLKWFYDLKRSNHIRWKHLFQIVIAPLFLMLSEREHFAQELGHAEVTHDIIDVLDHRQSSFEEETENVNDALEVVFSGHCFELDHVVGCEQGITDESLDRLLVPVIAILMENLLYKGEVYKWVLVVLLAVANILKLKVSVGVSQLVYDFYLGQQLDCNFGDLPWQKLNVFGLVF